MSSDTYRAIWSRLAKTGAPQITFFLVLSGCLILAYCVFFFGAERPFETEGVVVTGEVFDKDTRLERRSRGSPQLVHFLRFRYRTGDGRLREGDDAVDREFWEHTKPGDTLEVRYRNTRPDLSHLGRDAPSKQRLPLVLMLGLGAMMLLGGMAYAARSWAKASRSVLRQRSG